MSSYSRSCFGQYCVQDIQWPERFDFTDNFCIHQYWQLPWCVPPIKAACVCTSVCLGNEFQVMMKYLGLSFLGALFTFLNTVTLHGNESINITGYGLALDWNRVTQKPMHWTALTPGLEELVCQNCRILALQKRESYSWSHQSYRAFLLSQGLPILLRLLWAPRRQRSLVPVSPTAAMISTQLPPCAASAFPQCVPSLYHLSLTTTLWCGNYGSPSYNPKWNSPDVITVT